MERTEQEVVRLRKLQQLREKGFRYPNDVRVTATSLDVTERETFPTAEEAPRLTIAGRLILIRHMGKASFCHLLDTDGKVQLYVRKDALGDEAFEQYKELDIGDIVEVKGYPFLTKTGEKSLFCESIRLLVKCLIPLPEKWHGLVDVEARYRQRYLDLIANPEGREIFRIRAQCIRFLRDYFDSRGFLEVETPVLQHILGGATAKPFTTHYNALNADMILRIAPELPLKKLVVGGFDNVYEFARNFRNEGLSRKHNPEFTMVEFYRAYATFEDNMDLTEEMLSALVTKVLGRSQIQFGDLTVNFEPPWKRISMTESLTEIGGVSPDIKVSELTGLHSIAEKHRIRLPEPNDWGKSLEAVWEVLVEPKLTDPTFITHHPFSISPLARTSDDNPLVTDRFELFIAGMEIANGYSELNDPEDQRKRFETQAARKATGDEEAGDVDEDFLRSLEYGLPPTSGEGIGIDRLVMLLTNQGSIRDVLLFPQLKNREDA